MTGAHEVPASRIKHLATKSASDVWGEGSYITLCCSTQVLLGGACFSG